MLKKGKEERRGGYVLDCSKFLRNERNIILRKNERKFDEKNNRMDGKTRLNERKAGLSTVDRQEINVKFDACVEIFISLK